MVTGQDRRTFSARLMYLIQRVLFSNFRLQEVVSGGKSPSPGVLDRLKSTPRMLAVDRMVLRRRLHPFRLITSRRAGPEGDDKKKKSDV